MAIFLERAKREIGNTPDQLIFKGERKFQNEKIARWVNISGLHDTKNIRRPCLGS